MVQTASIVAATVRECYSIERSLPLEGTVALEGAKNAVLVIMASLILTKGISVLRRVPPSTDVFHMIRILESLGIRILFDSATRSMIVDTRACSADLPIDSAAMGKLRASTLILGPLLARFGHAQIRYPGGDDIGKRPIDMHCKAFESMGAVITATADGITATRRHGELNPADIVLAYPSVGATENSMMAAALTKGRTRIFNAAMEPEIMDLAAVLRKMGATILCELPGIISIEGVEHATAIEHEIMFDRLEAGTFLLAAAITGGTITVKQAPVEHMTVFLAALQDMGHRIEVSAEGDLQLYGTRNARATSIRTMPYPGFPTDLQGPMLVAQLVAQGSATIHETVYERRFGHVHELQRMGAQITILGDFQVVVQGGSTLRGTQVIAGDIRAAAALTLAGLVAEGRTTLFGLEHIKRGYVDFAQKLQALGAPIIYTAS